MSILLNNVGVLFEENRGILPQTFQQIIDMIVINCCSQVGMFKIVWPQMKERSAKKNRDSKCAIVDLSSMASIMPVSEVGVYSATKSFNRLFTLGLASYLSSPKSEGSKLVTPIDFLSV